MVPVSAAPTAAPSSSTSTANASTTTVPIESLTTAVERTIDSGASSSSTEVAPRKAKMRMGMGRMILSKARKSRPFARSLILFVMLIVYLGLTSFRSGSTKELLVYLKEGADTKDLPSSNNATIAIERSLEVGETSVASAVSSIEPQSSAMPADKSIVNASTVIAVSAAATDTAAATTTGAPTQAPVTRSPTSAPITSSPTMYEHAIRNRSILEQHSLIKLQALASLNDASYVPPPPDAALQLLRLPVPPPPPPTLAPRRKIKVKSNVTTVINVTIPPSSSTSSNETSDPNSATVTAGSVTSRTIVTEVEEEIEDISELNATMAPTIDNSTKPIMAIITSTSSKGREHMPVDNSLLVSHLLPSIVRTISAPERQKWRVHVYVAVDDTDQYWLQHWDKVKIPNADQSWLNLTFGVFPTRPGNIPFNEMALVAYNEGAEYFCRVNDDTEFITAQWITEAVDTLQHKHDPPNFGVVAPKCGQGNLAIMTHDFVHRTHMDIFHGQYYPPIFDNYYLDDWISFQYTSHVLGPSFDVSHILNAEVKHWVYQSRYKPRGLVVQWLPIEYERGRRLIAEYMNRTHPIQAQRLAPALAGPKYAHADIVQAVRKVLPPNGNMLVWGLDGDSHYWHRATSGTVLFLYEETFKEFETVFIKPQNYIIYHKVEYKAGVRGNPQDGYAQFVANQTLDSNNWCNLYVKLPDFVFATTWDVIWINTPKVCTTLDNCEDASGPGIFQPLYLSQTIVTTQLQRARAKLAAGAAAGTAAKTHVFVNDYERPYAQEFAQSLFDAEPAHVVNMENGTKQLAHFTLGHNDSLVNHTVEFCPILMDFKRTVGGFVQYSYPSPASFAQSSLVRAPESWIILLEVNDAYFAFLEIWFHYFAPLNISIPVVIMTEDDQVEAAINDLLPRYSGINVTLERSVDSENATRSSTPALDWGTVGFNTMVGKRPVHILQWLEQGLNVISTDVDTVWRSNPLLYLVAAATSSSSVDIVASINSIEFNGFSPYFNPGFMAVQSNARTMELMKQWAALHRPPAAPATNTFTFNTALQQQSHQFGVVSHQPLQWREFPNGQVYFEQYSEEQRNNVVVVHNDFILGYETKKARFEKHGFWKATPRNNTAVISTDPTNATTS